MLSTGQEDQGSGRAQPARRGGDRVRPIRRVRDLRRQPHAHLQRQRVRGVRVRRVQVPHPVQGHGVHGLRGVRGRQARQRPEAVLLSGQDYFAAEERGGVVDVESSSLVSGAFNRITMQTEYRGSFLFDFSFLSLVGLRHGGRMNEV